MVAGPNLLIAIPCRNEIRALVFPHLVHTLLQGVSYWHREHGDALVTTNIQPRAHVVTARNVAVEEARAMGVEWILWLDDDMAPPPDLLARLHRTREPFVGALAYKRDPPYLPCVYRIAEGRAEPFDPDPTQGVVDADLTGFACVLTHRSVFDAVWERTDGHPFQLQGDIGEDFFFCLQARKAGFQLKIVADCVVGHATDLVIGREHRLAALHAAAQ